MQLQATTSTNRYGSVRMATLFQSLSTNMHNSFAYLADDSLCFISSHSSGRLSTRLCRRADTFLFTASMVHAIVEENGQTYNHPTNAKTNAKSKKEARLRRRQIGQSRHTGRFSDVSRMLKHRQPWTARRIPRGGWLKRMRSNAR